MQIMGLPGDREALLREGIAELASIAADRVGPGFRFEGYLDFDDSITLLEFLLLLEEVAGGEIAWELAVTIESWDEAVDWLAIRLQ